MKRVAALLLAGLWLLAAGGAAAQVVLGDIEVGSLRGEPFMARIALPELPEGGGEGLRVRIGNAGDFIRYGIERLPHLTSLAFRVVADGPEPAHVLITGRDPIDSPFVTFLVEAAWPGGRVLREYTVLLDSAPADAAGAYGRVGETDTAGSYGPVGETDTLWSLADRYRPEGVSVQRMMVALLAANPHAFAIENVNALRAGAMLEIPALDRVGPDDKLSAMAEVRRQNETWRTRLESLGADVAVPATAPPETAGDEGTAPPSGPEPEGEAQDERAAGEAPEAELRVISPGTGEVLITGNERELRAELDMALEEADSRRQEVDELGARLDEAEQLITDLQRLVELKDDDIAELQRRLAVETEEAAAARSEALAQAGLAARAQEEAAAEARAAERARAEAQLQAEVAARARAEVEVQSELAARAQEEARVQAEVAAQAQARAEVAAQTRAAESNAVRTPPEAAAPEQTPEQAPDPAEEDAAPADDAGAETAAAEEEAGEEVEAEEPAAAPPSMLASLEDLLGFSPVVAGVGLVGVILILGGLIALMRRRSSASEYSDEDEVSDEDASTEALEDEPERGEEAAEPGDAASTAPEAQAPKTELRGIDREPEVDDFDIGIDPDEDVMREVGEDLVSDLDIDRAGAAPERERFPVGTPDSGRVPPRPGLDDGGRGGSPAAPEGAGRAEPGDSAPYPSVSGSSAPVVAGDGDRDESGSAFIVEEDPAGDIDGIQTKLDLAQTYIDMEDYEDARALLRDVQAEGDLEQRAIARYLAGKLP